MSHITITVGGIQLKYSERASQIIADIDELEVNQRAAIKSKDKLFEDIKEMKARKKLCEEDLEIVTNAVAILQKISDNTVEESKDFIQESLNSALSRIFKKSTRKIRIKEYTTRGTYPQLELELTVEGGEVRAIKNSGHGLIQIVSLLCVLCLIVMTGNRRVLLLDEVLSGLSARTRKVVDNILWAFASIGFQFIINEHGFIPKGAHVVQLEMSSGISNITKEYIEPNGVYLDGNMLEELDTEMAKMNVMNVIKAAKEYTATVENGDKSESTSDNAVESVGEVESESGDSVGNVESVGEVDAI